MAAVDDFLDSDEHIHSFLDAPDVPVPDEFSGTVNAVGRGLSVGQSDRLRALKRSTVGDKQLLGAGFMEELSPEQQAQLAPEIARVDTSDKPTYGQALKDVRAENKAFSDAHPVLSTAGEVAGSVASPLLAGVGALAGRTAARLPGAVPPAAVAAGARIPLAQIGAKAAIEGGTMGAGLSTSETPEGIAEDAALGTAAGGGTAGLFGLASRWINPQTSPAVRYLLSRGVTPKPGQILGGVARAVEEKSRIIPVAGEAMDSAQRTAVHEFNRASYQEALTPLGDAAVDAAPKSAGASGVEQVGKIISDKYDAVVPQMTFDAVKDPNFRVGLANLTAMAQSMPKAMAKIFNTELKENLLHHMGPTGTMDGETVQIVSSKLRQLATDYGSGANKSVAQRRLLGNAFKEANRLFSDSLELQNPTLAPDFSAANKAWANYAVLRDAAGRAGSKNGVYMPATLMGALRKADKSAGKMKTTTGKTGLGKLAKAGDEVLGSVYPDSGTGGRMMHGAAIVGLGAASVPLAAKAAALSVPYLPGGRQAMAALLARRPAGAAPVARAIERLGQRSGLPLTAFGTTELVDQGD